VHRLVGRDLEASLGHISVEDHVQVLIGRNPLRQWVGDRLVASLAGVAVRHPGGQFLERHIDHGIEQAVGDEIALALVVLARRKAAGHLLDTQLLQLDRVDGAGDDQLVAQRDAVPVLLGRPAVDPLPPGAVVAEGRRDFAVVRGLITLQKE
jgi:hypothetical protein